MEGVGESLCGEGEGTRDGGEDCRVSGPVVICRVRLFCTEGAALSERAGSGGRGFEKVTVGGSREVVWELASVASYQLR